MLKSLGVALVVALASGALPPAAGADGLPLNADASQSGVLSPRGLTRYVTATADRQTAVIAQDASTGAVDRTTFLRGTFTVPLVAYDGTPAGISADGRILVLIRPRTGFPRARTVFAVMETKPRAAGLRLRRRVGLDGDFSFDALSADGASLFLIHYISRHDPSKYRVRVYDMRTGRLDPKPIVDPRESADEMNGIAVTRAASPDGRWAYTLYDGNGGHPFIHALDTSERRAVCIDLHGTALADPYALRLEVTPGGRAIDVLRRRRPVATVDTRTFRVRTPAVASSDGGTSWLPPIAVVACLLAAAALLLRRRRRSRIPVAAG